MSVDHITQSRLVGYERVERGFGEPCWMPLRLDGMRAKVWKANIRRWISATVGDRGPGELYQHLCEVHGDPERNLCINPAHIVIGTKSSNAAHWHQLRRDAGLPWTGARRRGPFGSYKKSVADVSGDSVTT